MYPPYWVSSKEGTFQAADSTLQLFFFIQKGGPPQGVSFSFMEGSTISSKFHIPVFDPAQAAAALIDDGR